MDSINNITEFLLSKLNIYVTGACGPKREEPMQCFRPVHQSYRLPVSRVDHPIAVNLGQSLPGGSLRILTDISDGDQASQPALVYDRDIERAFEWAIGQEVMSVAIETFVDSEQVEAYDPTTLIQCFGTFLGTLDIQPVTVPISSLVEHMMGTYAYVTGGLSGFSWQPNMEKVVEEFVYTRECFFFPQNRAPVLHVAFTVLYHGQSGIDVQLHFGWNPPVMNFHYLRNIISEGENFVMQPLFDYLPHNSDLPITEEYFLGGQDNWLRWNPEQETFHGRVPHRIASHVGAERVEAYTMELELTSRVSKQFPGNMRFERTIRCMVPLTVRRQPTTCRGQQERMSSPTLPRPTSSSLVQDMSPMRSPLRRLFPRSRTPPPTPRSRAVSRECEADNDQVSSEEVTKLLARKAQESRPSLSPIKLSSLNLARLHDAIAMSRPDPHSTTFEVRTVHDMSQTPNRSPAQNKSGAQTSFKPSPLQEALARINRGSAHVNRHSMLASRSDFGQENQSPDCSIQSPSTKDITPLASSIRESAKTKGEKPLPRLGSPVQRPKSISARSDLYSPGGTDDCEGTCNTCVINERTPHFEEKDSVMVCLSCQDSSKYGRTDEVSRRGSQKGLKHVWGTLIIETCGQDSIGEANGDWLPMGQRIAEHARCTTDEWQAQIQENFKEFESKLDDEPEKGDTIMDDIVDSEEELSGILSEP